MGPVLSIVEGTSRFQPVILIHLAAHLKLSAASVADLGPASQACTHYSGPCWGKNAMDLASGCTLKLLLEHLLDPGDCFCRLISQGKPDPQGHRIKDSDSGHVETPVWP